MNTPPNWPARRAYCRSTVRSNPTAVLRVGADANENTSSPADPLTGCRPADRLEADRAAMLALPPVAPVVGWRSSQRLPRDHYVRLDAHDYSVHPSVIGRRIEVTADLHRVRGWCDGRLVADHERRWSKHQTVHDPEHLAAARTVRRQRLEVVRPTADTEVETRRLADYDTLLGADGGVA
jgi:transposase